MNGAVLLGNSAAVTFDEASGSFVSAAHQRLAEVLNDFDDTLELQWIPPSARTSADTRPFALVQHHPNYPTYVVMYLKEDELDHRVLARLYEARLNAEGDLDAKLRSQEMAAQLMKAKERAEDAEIAADKARFLWRTPLHSPTMDGKKYRL